MTPRPRHCPRLAGALLVRLAALALLLAGLLAAPAPALAQDVVSDFLGALFGTRHAPPPRAKPVTAPRKSKPRPAPSAVRAPAPAPNRPPPAFFVAVIGDSLAGQLAQGLTEAFADDPRVAILNRTRDNSGLVRDDVLDWRLEAKKLLEGPQHIDMAVMQIGVNDNQKLRLGDVALEPLTRPFNEIYAKRVEETAAVFRDRNVPLVWVGLPIMRGESLSHAALAFNEMDRQYAGALGARYVDLWEPFSDLNSAYKATGPDVNGVIMRLRAADGVHFNKAGARKAAHFVESEIRHAMEAALQPANLPTPVETQPATPQPETQLTTPPTAEPPPKPIAGKVQSLSEPAVAPGGALAGVAAPAGFAPVGAPVQPGRADDFRWPEK